MILSFHKPRMLAIPLLAVLAVSSSPTQNPSPHKSPAHVPAQRRTVIGVSNFAEVTPHLFRGGQPKQPAGYAALKKMGVDIVVDLRLSGKGKEKNDVESAGMSYVAIPWHCYFPKDKVFAKFLTVLYDNPGKKVFVHCRYGDDRTGMAIAAYRMAVEGWTSEESRKEMEKFGFHHLICPSLGPYEKHFPDHLQKSSAFKHWREPHPAREQ